MSLESRTGPNGKLDEAQAPAEYPAIERKQVKTAFTEGTWTYGGAYIPGRPKRKYTRRGTPEEQWRKRSRLTQILRDYPVLSAFSNPTLAADFGVSVISVFRIRRELEGQGILPIKPVRRCRDGSVRRFRSIGKAEPGK